ncbi:SAM-dependent methyltransferase [Nocardia jiangsuensis]|uniref:SAM-dependent methyltransferase n=1 Tax=Nocardia jiangsuensis TaxID=1691563 RepID=A0ABV8E2G8_9NOCA
MSDNSPSVEIDQSKPSIARVYDYVLGGKDNYPVDQAIGDHFIHNLPGSVAIAKTNRDVLVRAVRELAADGIRQFIDLGSGLPTSDNVHQVAARHAAGSKVVYVDNDPIVLAHGRAILATDDNTVVIQADAVDPEGIRNHPELRRLIDFDQPVAVIFSAILHHLEDRENPLGIVRFWRDQLPPGSALFISHFRSGDNDETKAAEGKLQETFGRGRWRTDSEIAAFFEGLDLAEPGIVPAVQWRPDRTGADAIGSAERELTVWEQLIVAGLGYKR